MYPGKVKNFYLKNPQYATRLKTDVFIPFGTFKATGIEDVMAKFIEDFQLLDENYWKAFVNQYRKGDADLADVGWRGEYWGKMMRGAAITYQYTKNRKLYELLVRTTEDLLTTQDEKGRFATYPIEAEYQHWDVWSRKYIALGILHFCEICEDENLKDRCIKALCKHMDYIINTIGKAEDGKIEIFDTSIAWLGVNASSILEPFARLYNYTGEKRYFDFAQYIIDTGAGKGFDIFEKAFKNDEAPYKWPVRKAYELISNYEGIIEMYRITGVEKYKELAINFANRVIETDISIIGCSGCEHELFDHSSATQTWTENELIMQENCVSVTWMKFCYQLLCLTGESYFADEIEKTVYNALYGAVNTEKSTNNNGFAFDSYSPLLLQKRGRKVGGGKVMDEIYPFGCCAAIGAHGTGMVPSLASQITEKGIVINMYMNTEMCTVTPQNNDLKVKIDTKYPKDGYVKIAVEPEKNEIFEIMLRIPGFSENTEVMVNGEKVDAVAGTYLALEQEWEKGDVITLDLDMAPHVIHPEGVENDKNSLKNIAVKYGPLVLARDSRFAEDVGQPVNLDYDENDSIVLVPSETADFPTLCEFEVPLKNGGFTRMVDYQSAGKTWDYDSAMEAWMPTEKYSYYINLCDIIKK